MLRPLLLLLLLGVVACECGESSPRHDAVETTAVLPDLEQQNAAWLEHEAGRVHDIVTDTSCEPLEGHGDPDLHGQRTRVSCEDPPRLCSGGSDARLGTDDDQCTEIAARDSRLVSSSPTALVLGETNPQIGELRASWERRFLDIGESMTPGGASPEAAIAHFYASWLRRDRFFLQVLPPEAEWNDTLRAKIDRMRGTEYSRVRLEGLRCSSDSCQFRVLMEVVRGESTTAGHDEGELTRAGDGWRVTRPPT